MFKMPCGEDVIKKHEDLAKEGVIEAIEKLII